MSPRPLDQDGTAAWWSDVDTIIQSGALARIFEQLGCDVSSIRLSDLDDRMERLSVEHTRGFEVKQRERAMRPYARFEDRSLTMAEAISQLRTERDPLIWFIFQSVWEDAPDNPIIHTWPQWGRLCNICSDIPNDPLRSIVGPRPSPEGAPDQQSSQG